MRLLSVLFRLRRSWPQDDFGAVERTRTVASGERFVRVVRVTGVAFHALIWRGVRERRSASKKQCRRECRSSRIDKPASESGLSFTYLPLSPVLRPPIRSFSSCLLSDSFGTCSPANVTLGCLVDGVFCAVERHNDTGQKLSMPRTTAYQLPRMH